MIKYFKGSLILSLLFLISCSPSKTIIDSPNVDGGLQGDASQDEVDVIQDNRVTDLFKKIYLNGYFSYDTTVKVGSTDEHFVQYYTPYAWYSDSDIVENSIGYGMTYEGYYMFRYYLNETKDEVYPSIYEYGGYDTLEKIQGLYSPLTISHPLFLEDTFDTLSYQKISPNRYLLTDTETMSVFQYMTTYGSSIANYIVAVYVDIIEEDNCIFDITIDLGSYGNIVSRYTPLNTTPIDFVNDLIIEKKLVGVDYYDEVAQMSETLKSNNFTLHGPKSYGAEGGIDNYSFDIICTNDYFLVDYKSNDFLDFGYAFIKKGKTVPVKSVNEDGTYSDQLINYTLESDACFSFEIDRAGNIYFDRFIGPIENENTDYLEVESLPAVGEEGVLYIVSENGKEVVYEWIEKDGVFQYSKYSDWYDCVGDFYIGTTMATFYLGSTAFLDLAPKLFEKDNYEVEDGKYHSNNSDIKSSLANGLFGWGFQSTTTWMNYITEANLTINKNQDDSISSYNIGLTVQAYINGVYKNEEVFYTIDNFNQSHSSVVENLINSLS